MVNYMKSIVMFKEVVDCLNSRFSSHEFIRKFLEKNHKEYAARLKKQDSVALDRRFNTMLTATTFDEFAYHLRQIFRLAKSKESFSVNFIKLSEDLFWYQNGKERNICLSWAKDYYHYAGKNEDL